MYKIIFILFTNLQMIDCPSVQQQIVVLPWLRAKNRIFVRLFFAIKSKGFIEMLFLQMIGA